MRSNGFSQRRVKPPRPRRRPQQEPGEGSAHPELGDDGAERAPVEALVEAVDEPQLERDVRQVGGDQDDQGRAQIAESRADSPCPDSATSAAGSPIDAILR